VAGNGDRFISGSCPKCGLVDGQSHRLYECQSDEAVRLRAHFEHVKALSEWVDRAKSRGPLALRRGWVPLRKPAWAARPSENRVFPDLDLNADFFIPGRPIFVDGSCFFAQFAEITAAGYAALQLDDDGNILRAVWGPVPVGIPLGGNW